MRTENRISYDHVAQLESFDARREWRVSVLRTPLDVEDDIDALPPDIEIRAGEMGALNSRTTHRKFAYAEAWAPSETLAARHLLALAARAAVLECIRPVPPFPNPLLARQVAG
nr:hypothetical protein [Sinorhizobium medicae]